MNGKSKILWIVRTAIFIALLVVWQAVTASLGQLVTGSVVNLLLIVSVMTCGFMSGLCVAVVSPVMAKLLGIGPLWGLIPFIALGSITLVLLWHLVGNLGKGNRLAPYIAALAVGAAGKFIVLYVGIVVIAVPLLLGLPAKQAATISGMFSFMQLLTASVGGVLAILILPTLKKAIKPQGGT